MQSGSKPINTPSKRGDFYVIYLRIMNRKFCLCIIAILFIGFMQSAQAQNIAVKTNLLYDATATVNAGVEIGLAPKWTLDISGNLNAWSKNEHTKWKHWMVQPEARYWFCDRFSRHFLGAHLIGGAFNFGNINKNRLTCKVPCLSYPKIL